MKAIFNEFGFKGSSVQELIVCIYVRNMDNLLTKER